jgi:hypothetical protein
VEILLWLVPAGVATLLAMLWVSWLGRDGRGEVDRDVLLARFAEAMEREHPGRGRPTPPALDRPRERSTGIAVRRSRGAA